MPEFTGIFGLFPQYGNSKFNLNIPGAMIVILLYPANNKLNMIFLD